MELDADDDHHKFIYLDEAGFNLAKTRRRGQNFIGQRATIQVPGQRGANITMCAAISEDGVVGRRPHIGPYNAALLVTFLDELDQVCRAEGVTYVIVWDNVRFHHAHVVQAWFQAHAQFTTLYLPPYSPFLNPIEEFSPHGDGRFMIGTLMNKSLFSRPWMTPAMTSQQTSVRPGFAMPEGFFQDVWLMKTSIVM